MPGAEDHHSQSRAKKESSGLKRMVHRAASTRHTSKSQTGSSPSPSGTNLITKTDSSNESKTSVSGSRLEKRVSFRDDLELIESVSESDDRQNAGTGNKDEDTGHSSPKSKHRHTPQSHHNVKRCKSMTLGEFRQDNIERRLQGDLRDYIALFLSEAALVESDSKTAECFKGLTGTWKGCILDDDCSMPQYNTYYRSFEDPEAGELQVLLDILSTVHAHICLHHTSRKKQFEGWQRRRIDLLMKKKIEVRRKLQEKGVYDSQQEDEVVDDVTILDRSRRKEVKKPKDKQRASNIFIRNSEINRIIREGGLDENMDLFFGIARTTRIVESYVYDKDKNPTDVFLRPGSVAWGPCIFNKGCTSMSEQSVPSATAKTCFGDEVRSRRLHIAVLEAVLDHFNKYHRQKAGEKTDKSQIKLAGLIETRRNNLRKSEAEQLQNPRASERSRFKALPTIDDYDNLPEAQ